MFFVITQCNHRKAIWLCDIRCCQSVQKLFSHDFSAISEGNQQSTLLTFDDCQHSEGNKNYSYSQLCGECNWIKLVLNNIIYKLYINLFLVYDTSSWVCVCVCALPPNVGWVGDDSSIQGVIEVCGIDETLTLMSLSQLIHRFICKWLLKGYWLRLPSACTYHANVMLSDTYSQHTFSGLRNSKTWRRKHDCLIADRLRCIPLSAEWGVNYTAIHLVVCIPLNFNENVFLQASQFPSASPHYGVTDFIPLLLYILFSPF